MAPAAAGAAPFRAGIFDGVFGSPDAAERTAWLDRTAAVGGRVVRLSASWIGIAPGERPSGFRASDPADPAYRWNGLDDAVRDAVARGLLPLVTIEAAPRWAEGVGRPASARPGTWRPSSRELGAFARAAAARYSGRFPDPQTPGATLPRVRLWQVWNEPNLASYLAPQWVRTRGGWRAESPRLYRALLNAAYAGIKAVHRDNTVATAGTAPYGDLAPGGSRIAPAAFVRALLCLDPWLRRSCRSVTRLDALAHHPYAVAGPLRRALNREDVALPDLGKLTRALRAAVARRTISPRRGKQLWVTEVSWDSSPPDPDGVPEARHAAWLQEGLYVLWRQGVRTVTWFQVRDHEEGAGFQFGNQSGLYFRDGRPKLAAQAFRFSLVTGSRSGSRVTVWGRAPAPGAVRVERAAGGAWVPVATLRAGGDGVFHRRHALARGTRLRAVQGGHESLVWTVR